jgi:aspartate aminotransferase-like enzyme
MNENQYLYKIANQEDEFKQIHRLNYITFAEEIPQHSRNEEGVLIDRFHQQNTYLVCIKNNRIIGMMAVRNKRPFSLDEKIGKVEDLMPFHTENLCEIRLLSIKKEHRNGRVFLGLSQLLASYCLNKGYDAAVISGTDRELKLYGQLGFKPFAKMTGTGDALFQPMYLDKETFEKLMSGRILKEPNSFLPGPVPLSPAVKLAVGSSPISHRSLVFQEKMTQAKNKLTKIVNAKDVQILLGSGTLANDLIAGQLSLLDGKGLILVNGEFGHRLKDHATRMGIRCDVLEKEWGQPFSEDEIINNLKENTTWIWAVHCETSTGMLIDMDMLKKVGLKYQIKICLDCISSIGGIKFDLEEIYLASGVSGKAIGSITGLSFVFHHHNVSPTKHLPRYLDLGAYVEMDSVPYSHSSILLEALLAALQGDITEKYHHIFKMYRTVRDEIEKMGIKIITDSNHSAPVILTLEIPKFIQSSAIGQMLSNQGYLLHYESSYLYKRNWIQIACIAENNESVTKKMLQVFKQAFDYELYINRAKLYQ